jgi:hypothetical protein
LDSSQHLEFVHDNVLKIEFLGRGLLIPVMSSYVSAAALGCAGLAAFALYERWSLRVADPNEWLLVIRDGKLHRAGIGLRFRASYQDSVVKIPARVYKVQFQAQQVTKEMQGVEVLFMRSQLYLMSP